MINYLIWDVNIFMVEIINLYRIKKKNLITIHNRIRKSLFKDDSGISYAIIFTVFICIFFSMITYIFLSPMVNNIIDVDQFMIDNGYCSQLGYDTLNVLLYIWQDLPLIVLFAIIISGIMIVLLIRGGT